MTKDMTQGTPWKLILQVSIPTALGLIFQQLYGMADTIIVGRFLGVNALAAVGATGSLSFLIIGFMQGVCSGISIPVAQYFGAQDKENLQKSIANGVWVSAILGVIVTIVTVLGTDWILTIMKTPENIFADAATYIRIIFLGCLATVLYNLTAGYLRSLGDSKTPLVFLVISSVLNVALDLLFIISFKMGVGGAAWATVLAQLVSGLLCLGFIILKFPALHVAKEHAAFSSEHAMQHISVGVPMGLQFSITAIGCAILQTATNTLGSGAVAAVTAASKAMNIFQCVLEAPGLTLATYSGQNYGAEQPERVHSGVKQGLILSLLLSAICAALVLTFGPAVGTLFVESSETAILEMMDKYYFYTAIFLPFLAVLFVYRNSIQGMGYTVPAMAAGVFELVARAAVSIFCVEIWGFAAVCLAGPVAWIAADVLLIGVYVKLMRQIGVLG